MGTSKRFSGKHVRSKVISKKTSKKLMAVSIAHNNGRFARNLHTLPMDQFFSILPIMKRFGCATGELSGSLV